MDDLRQLSTGISSVGETAKEQAAYLQAMSRRANQLAQMIDSYIHGTLGNEAADICTSLVAAGDQMTTACFALMKAWNTSQQWLNNHVPVTSIPLAPIGEANPFVLSENNTNSGTTDRVEARYNIPASEREYENADQAIMYKYDRITSPHTAQEDLKNTNPNWREDTPWDINCQRCVSAYEARRRGYDVIAAPLTDSHDTLQIMKHPNGWPSVYKDAELIDCSSTGSIGSEALVNEKMAEWGDGARAIVRVRWKLGGGHVFIAERVNGCTKYVDPQRGTEDVNYYFESAKGKGTYCMRIDNLPFTERIHDCIE